MLTVTFSPATPAQAALVGQLIAAYVGADAGSAGGTAEPAAAPEVEAAKPVAKAEQVAKPAAETAPPPANPAGPTLVEVRATLARLSNAGKTDEVKALLKKFGASKLTDVPAEKYTALITEAEALA